MPRAFSLKSTPDLCRQDAKRWLASLRAGDPQALQRLRDAWPQAPAEPTLRDVQHAVAREYGLADWTALLAALDDIALDRQSRAERIDVVLGHGWNGDAALARRIVARDPSLAGESLWLACVCGDVDAVTRFLARDASLARGTGGPHHWSALAHLCYSRVDADHAVTIATMLLDAGADPNFRFDDGWGNQFTCITGAIGLGEGVTPSHAQADALVRLLLDRGADPFDTQSLYNDSIAADDPHWMAMLWDACAQAGRSGEWQRIEGKGFGGRIKVGTLNFLLGNAVSNRHLRRATWLLEHGADARTLHAYAGQPVHTVARLSGDAAMARLLEMHGAAADTSLNGVDALQTALMSGDIAAARALVAREPAALTGDVFAKVAGHGSVESVALLLDLGIDINARDHDGATALHSAAHAQSIPVLELLLARGADPDVRDARWQATPLGWCVHLGLAHAAVVLAPHSRDLRALARSGRVQRLEEVLRESPALAHRVERGAAEPTALFSLPDDDRVAAAVASILVRAGADSRVRDAKGRTAEAAARFRGLDEAAAILAAAER